MFEDIITLAQLSLENLEVCAMINGLIEESIVKKIKRHCKVQGDLGYDLLTCYKKLYNTKYKEYCDLLLKKQKLRYCSVIHEAISWLLLPNLGFSCNPFLDVSFFPGIHNIQKCEDYYLLDTVLGRVSVKNAKDVFRGTETDDIFRRPLEHSCYQRCYEFLQINPDYKVVFSFMPCRYLKGYYHVYVVKKNIVIDITSNAYYEDSSFKIPLKGKIIKVASKEEIEEKLLLFPDNFPLHKDLFLLMNYYYLQQISVNQIRKRQKR